MSQFLPALIYVLDWEDPKREFMPVPDVGGMAISGINSSSWPQAYKEVLAAGANDRPKLVSDFYLLNFWNPMKIGGLTWQDITSRVFDEGVNASAEVAVKVLQRSLNLLSHDLKVDGDFGPLTMEAANSQESDRLLAAFRTSRLTYYKEIIVAHPDFSKYLGDWEKRALA